MQIFFKQGTYFTFWHINWKKIDLFATNIAAGINQILLIGCNQAEFIFSEETAIRGKFFIFLFANFN